MKELINMEIPLKEFHAKTQQKYHKNWNFLQNFF